MRETEDFIFDDDGCRWKDVLSSMWTGIADFVESWIWPGHYVRNLLFRRYDRVRIRSIRPWEYSDTCERMKCALFELVCEFVDGEESDPVVEWYGEHGPKMNGEYAMDIAKEIRSWWRVRRAEQERKYLDFQAFCCRWVFGKLRFHRIDESTGFGRVTFEISHLPSTLDGYLEAIGDDEWAIFDAVCDDRSKILDAKFMREKCDELELGLDEADDRYLHRAIDIRRYLWS